jgi:hypothetical protein
MGAHASALNTNIPPFKKYDAFSRHQSAAAEFETARMQTASFALTG